MFETISNTVSVRYKISHPDWFGVLRIIQVMIIHRFKFQQTLGRTNTMHPHVVAAAKAYYHHMHLHKHWQGHMFTCQKHIPQIHWPLKGQARPGKVSHHTLKCNSTPDSTTLFGFPFVRSVVHLFIFTHTHAYMYIWLCIANIENAYAHQNYLFNSTYPFGEGIQERRDRR